MTERLIRADNLDPAVNVAPTLSRVERRLPDDLQRGPDHGSSGELTAGPSHTEGRSRLTRTPSCLGAATKSRQPSQPSGTKVVVVSEIQLWRIANSKGVEVREFQAHQHIRRES
jgi:hypothetical protein